MMEHRKSMGDALIHVMDQIGKTWNKPLKYADKLSRRQRFIYAFVGAFSWFTYNLADRGWTNALESLAAESVVAVTVIVIVYYILFHALLGAWFAWLIAYQSRNCSPSRFFLEGILFPGVASTLITSSQSLSGLF